MTHHGKKSIKARIIRSSILLTLIPVTILEVLFSVLVYRSTFSHITERSAAYADQLAYLYQAEMEKVEQMADTLANFSPLSEYLNRSFSSREEELVYFMDNINPMLSGCDSTYSGARVRIYHNSPDTHVYSFTLSDRMDELLESEPFQSRPAQSDAFWLNEPVRYYSYVSLLSYYRIVRNTRNPQELSYIISIHLSKESLHGLISGTEDPQSMVLVLDRQGNVLTNSKDGNPLPGGYDTATLTEGSADGTEVRIGAQRYLALGRRVGPLRIVYLVYSGSVQAELFRTIIQIVLAGVLLLALSTYLTVRTSNGITQGIARLRQKMKHISLERIGALTAETTMGDSEDEIEQLDAVFTDMMAEIQALVEDVRKKDLRVKDEIIARQQAEMQQAQAAMDALQYQINPHYLFNTLEAIRMNLLIKGDQENAEIVKLFAESYRQQISVGTHFVTLFSEIEFIKKYIQILNYRLRDVIELRCRVDVSVYHVKIPKLLIQPVVENAVNHGIEVSGRPGVITMTAEQDGMDLRICVRDNGVGMDETQLAALRSSVASEHAERSVGLPNVYRRMKLAYGQNASMEIRSRRDQGTEVELRLPVFWEEDGNVSGIDCG